MTPVSKAGFSLFYNPVGPRRLARGIEEAHRRQAETEFGGVFKANNRHDDARHAGSTSGRYQKLAVSINQDLVVSVEKPSS